MWLGLLGIIVLGVAVGGCVLFLTRILRIPLPRWVLPAAAGGSMLVAHVGIEQTWFDRTRAALPEHVVVAKTITEGHWLQPWTLLVPPVRRFIAVDRASVRTNPAVPDQVMAEVVFMARFVPTATSLQMFDCAGHRRADITGTSRFAPDGQLENPAWTPLGADDPLLAAVCEPSEPTG